MAAGPVVGQIPTGSPRHQRNDLLTPVLHSSGGGHGYAPTYQGRLSALRWGRARFCGSFFLGYRPSFKAENQSTTSKLSWRLRCVTTVNLT